MESLGKSSSLNNIKSKKTLPNTSSIEKTAQVLRRLSVTYSNATSNINNFNNNRKQSVRSSNAFDILKSVKIEPITNQLNRLSYKEIMNYDNKQQFNLINNQMNNELDIIISRSINLYYNQLIHRIEYYWRACHISKVDQSFYRRVLFTNQSPTIIQCKELGRYLYHLQIHKSMIVNVLTAIESREKSIYSFMLLIQSISEKLKINSNINDLSNYWKDEFISLLRDIRVNTIDVIRNIQLWRRGLWRPLPFFWCNVNYIEKIIKDSEFLLDPVVIKLFTFLSIRQIDLLGLVFVNDNRINSYEDTYDDLSNYRDQLVNDVDRDALLSAVKVIDEEKLIAEALAKEKETLREKGVFIPTLQTAPYSN